GVGGMGVVCEAVHLDLGKRVALKLIDKSMKESEMIVARFRREAWAASQIESEHIVDVFDVGADARVGLYMVMEHLSGEDMETRIQRERMDVRTAVMISHQIARGLLKAHAAGVVHRDLKPANVFLTTRDNGQLFVKILDFGVSKLLGDEGYGPKITGTGAPVGTPLYMSPEQAEGLEDCDGRADIWSLGAVMYEALSGKSAFPDRGSYHGTIVGILTTKPEPLSKAAPWVPTAVAKLVDDMLVHDRDARVPDAQTVTRRLIEAYPTVLPDGTGRHTAVIVSASADETGDTEVFNSASMPAALRKVPSSKPRVDESDSARTMPRDDEDSKLTLPRTSDTPPPHDAAKTDPGVDVHFTDPGVADLRASASPSGPPLPSDRGGAVSGPPYPGDRAGYISAPPVTADPRPSGPQHISGYPISSASGVAMPLTPPPDIAPPSAVPDTVRDLRLAKQAALRRTLTGVVLLLVVIGIAAGSYFAGQRQSTSKATAPPPSATSLDGVAPKVSAAPTPTAAPAPTAAPTDSAAPASPEGAPEAPAATATATAKPPTTRKHAPSPKANAAPAAPAGASDTPAETPAPTDEP
ncbi:MAG: protein kinase, partial [Myxococcales bacterium]|nr:protein kinase [Myxococcales bacterium]